MESIDEIKPTMRKTKTKKIVIVSAVVVLLLVISFALLSGLGVFKKKLSYKLVNGNVHIYKGECLTEGYVPKDLVTLSTRLNWLNTTQQVDARIEKPLEQMIMDAEKDGMCLVVTSGYRSADSQRELWDKSNYSDLIAPPNCSEHQTGLVADLQACPMRDGKRDDTVERLELIKPFKELPEYQWLVTNAGKYGFEQSFKEDNVSVTGYPEESWHWKYIIK
jgi:D-alanyl-D-alanine carboxypeptidase